MTIQNGAEVKGTRTEDQAEGEIQNGDLPLTERKGRAYQADSRENNAAETAGEMCDDVLTENGSSTISENGSDGAFLKNSTDTIGGSCLPAIICEDDPENWKEEGKNTSCQLLLVVFGLVMYFADVGTDIKVAVDHLTAGDYVWGVLTLILVIVPSVVMQLVSLWWFKEDTPLNLRTVVSHLFGLGPVVRYFRTIAYILGLRKMPDPDIDDCKRLVSKKLDIAMLCLFQAFMEDAPQLVLQLYIKTTLRQYNIELTRVRDLWLVCSLLLSLVSLSWALLNYYKTLRTSVRSNIQLSGLVVIFLWRFFSVSSRVITLALFASIYKRWFFVLFGAHYFVMLGFLIKQKIAFFPGQKVKQLFFKSLFAYVLFFSYFSIEGERTRKWSVIFHVISGMEIIGLIVLWHFQQTHFSDLFSTGVLITVIAAFFLSIFLMSLYYARFHPSYKLILKGWGFKFQERTLSQRRRRARSSTCAEQNNVITDVARVVCLSVSVV